MSPVLRLGVAAALVLLVGPALGGCLKLGDPLGDPSNPRVLLWTSYGNMTLELFPRLAPRTAENFLEYVRAHFYDGLVFHRVIKGFVLQGGGLWPNGTEKPALLPPIPLEVHPELTHRDGCLAMARTDEPDSATGQFYICDGPQHRLDDAESRAATGRPGYAVFGRVSEGLPVVRAIADARTDSQDRPLRPVVIVEVREPGPS